MRWATSVETECSVSRGSRWSVKQAATRSNRPIARPPLPEQQCPGVGGDRAAVECGRDLAALTALKGERDGLTLCRHDYWRPVPTSSCEKSRLAKQVDSGDSRS